MSREETIKQLTREVHCLALCNHLTENQVLSVFGWSIDDLPDLHDAVIDSLATSIKGAFLFFVALDNKPLIFDKPLDTPA